jgi:hypothetical protein
VNSFYSLFDISDEELFVDGNERAAMVTTAMAVGFACQKGYEVEVGNYEYTVLLRQPGIIVFSTRWEVFHR